MRRSSADGRDAYYSVNLRWRRGPDRYRRRAPSGPALRRAAPRANLTPDARARAVPVHRQQLAVANGRGVARAPVGRSGRRSAREPPEAAASRSRARDGRTRHRPARQTIQAPRRVPRPAIRLRDHPVRPRARGLSGVSRRARIIHWSMRRPAPRTDGDPAAFERTAAELETRIRFLLARSSRTASERRHTMTRRDRQRPLHGRRRRRRDRVLHQAPRVRAAHEPSPAFADVKRGQSAAAARRARRARPDDPCPTGARPGPEVGIGSTCSSTTSTPKSRGCAPPGLTFRNDIVTGPGGEQILLEDPSGNPVELFQPAGT